MDKEFLKEILSIPTYFGKENRIKDYIISYGIKNKIPVKIDNKGNVYLIKGQLEENEKYPCVVAHMDTVHLDQISDIKQNNKLTIHEEKFKSTIKLWASQEDNGISLTTGCGGDDKAGIAICLNLINKHDKIIGAFFVEEEFGCKGSMAVDKEILKDVGYFIEFDAPANFWCSFSSNGVQLFNEELFNKIEPTLKNNNVNHISNDPYTDVFQLKMKFDVVCMNFFAGYYNMHSKNEYVLIEDVEKAINMGDEIIKILGLNKHKMIYNEEIDYKFYNKIQKWIKNNNEVFS